MSRYYIRAVCFANGAPCPIAGQYVKSFDFDAYKGRGHGVFTDDRTRALPFATAAAALDFWGATSSLYPKRADGLPNRPLTSTSCEIEEATP